MSTPWNLYNEVSKNNTRNYSVYRCPEPTGIKTGSPWYPGNGDNICPCDPNLSNSSGRGFTACPLGINLEEPDYNYNSQKLAGINLPDESQVTGSMYNNGQLVPPQLQPRQLIRIGEEWRSSN